MHDIIFQKQIGDETELEKGIPILCMYTDSCIIFFLLNIGINISSIFLFGTILVGTRLWEIEKNVW